MKIVCMWRIFSVLSSHISLSFSSISTYGHAIKTMRQIGALNSEQIDALYGHQLQVQAREIILETSVSTSNIINVCIVCKIFSVLPLQLAPLQQLRSAHSYDLEQMFLAC